MMRSTEPVLVSNGQVLKLRRGVHEVCGEAGEGERAWGYVDKGRV